MIYTELNEHSFAYELSSNKDNGFSYDWARELYNYFEGFGEDMEFDAVALRCEYSELTTEELIRDYWYTLEETEGGDREEYIEMLLDQLREETTIIKIWDSSTYLICTSF
jgi:hypothetical protein